MLSRMRPGQETLEQYAITSSEGYSTLERQTGQRSGALNGRSLPVRRSRTGPSTCGITSPARVTSTQSPSRMSFASIKSRSEEHTSELQSPCNLVCRLLLEKKKKNKHYKRNTKPSTPHTSTL